MTENLSIDEKRTPITTEELEVDGDETFGYLEPPVVEESHQNVASNELPPRIFTAEMQPENIGPVERLLWRQSAGYRPGIDQDGHKVGIAFEPGGAGGLVSFAEGYELARQELIDYADGAYGVSVGNINAIYAATGQWEDGLDVYTKIMPKSFVKWFGLKINIKSLEDAVTKDRPLDKEKFRKSRLPVAIGVTRLNNYRKLIIKSTDEGMTPEKMIEWGLRGCHIPFIGGEPPSDEEGNVYSDAALGWETAVELAHDDGCTDVISLGNFLPVDMSKVSKTKMAVGVAGSRIAAQAADLFISKRDPSISRGDAYLASSSMNRGRYYDLVRRKRELSTLFVPGRSVYKGTEVESIFPLDPKNIPGLRHINVGMPELIKPNVKKYIIGRRVAQLAVRSALVEYKKKREKTVETTPELQTSSVA